jgi:hypothetical protein
MEEKPRRGFTDRRARRLTANAVVVGLIAAVLMLLLVSYWLAAPELGTYGWTVASIVAGLAAVSAMCVLAAYRVQLATDRQYEAADAVAAGWESGPVEPDLPPPPAPAPVPMWPIPVPPTPAARADRRSVEPVAPPARVEAVPAPAEQPAEVTEPAHH